MDAIVAAGGIPQPGEPLYEFTRGKPKALLEIAGKPMIQWVLDALDRAGTIGKVTIIGLQPGNGITSEKLTEFLPGEGNLLRNLHAGIKRELEIDPRAEHVLSVSSDIPTITGEMVDWVVKSAMQAHADICYNVIPRAVMEKTFPNSRRSYVRLKDAEVCGGDMNVIRTLTVTENDVLWEKIIESRKSAWKQASLVGFDILLLLLLRAITLEQGEKMVTRRLKISGRAILCPFAEVGMDVDKPHQLEVVREYLGRRIATEKRVLA